MIPTRDRAGFVEQAIRSALGGDAAPAHIVVVDAGSTDETEQRLRAFSKDIQVIRGPYSNAAMARNAGARAVRTAYIGFLDSDDLMLPAKISCLEPVLRSEPDVGLVHGHTEVIDLVGRPDHQATRRHQASYEEAARRGTSYAALARFCMMFTSATLVRRSAFEAVGGYDEGIDAFEDWDLYLRLSLESRLRYEPCTVARYRLWPGNVPWDRTAAGVIAVAQKHLAALAEVPCEMREPARFALLGRLAAAQHTLVRRRHARQAAWQAVRMRPVRAMLTPEIRRPLLHSLLPASVLRRRRPGSPAATI